MIVSYKWLQSFFDDDLPKPEELAELLTFHAFEIEGVEKVGDDTAIDIDVLPNRSSDCLSHRGIARELGTLLGKPLKDDPFLKEVINTPDSNILELDIQAKELVNRFSAVVINDIEVKESPDWLKERLIAIGQKPINNVVDIMNYVMFDIGQPLHALDRDKMSEKKGGYTVALRVARKQENMTTLTGEQYELDSSNLLIVDGNNDKPLEIAGVKGGKDPEVDSNTKNLVIEAANFNYVSIRKTSQKLKLWTDASIRFQNEPSAGLTLHGLREVVHLIQKIAGGEVEGYVDWYPHKEEKKKVSVAVPRVNNLLGTDISTGETGEILKRLCFGYEKQGDVFHVTPPFERTDINIPEDLIEEIGRVYGYRHIEATSLPEFTGEVEVNKRFYYAEKVRASLAEQGFSEVYTYTLRDKGEVEIENPLASDKAFLREGLSRGLSESLELNTKNAPLLGLEQVKLFEIGTVFKKDGEHTSLAIAISKKKGSMVLGEIIKNLETHLEARLPSGGEAGEVWEINFDELIEKLPEPESYDEKCSIYRTNREVKYKPISAYPFALRDIAVWVPNTVKQEEVLKLIQKEAGELLVRVTLFDTFPGRTGEKDNKISYAYHLVFQSSERTLSDEEVTEIMKKVEAALGERGEVR